MKITTKITLDLQRPNFATEVEVMQDDGETRILEIALASGGTAWDIPEGVSPVVVFRRPNGTKGMYDMLADGSPAVTTEGCTVTVVLSRQMLAIPGLVQASLQFEDAQLHQLTTFPFRVNVQANPYGGAQSVQDVVRLQWLETKLDEYLKTAAESGEFDGKPGKTPVKGLDYFTQEEIEQFQHTVYDRIHDEISPAIDTATQAASGANSAAKNAGQAAGTAMEAGEAANTSAGLANAAVAELQRRVDAGEFDGKTPVKGVDYWTEAEVQAAEEAVYQRVGGKLSPIVETVSGESIALDDASDSGLEWLRVFGRTEQNGTPTPEAPVLLVSPGDDGDVGISVTGKNLLDYEKWSSNATGNTADGVIEYKDNGAVLKSGTFGDLYTSYSAEDQNSLRIPCIPGIKYTLSWEHSGDFGLVFLFPNGEEQGMKQTSAENMKIDYIPLDEVVFFTFRIGVQNKNSTAIYKNIRVCVGEDTGFKPYNPIQPLTIPTPNGLPGIKVDSGGNYTDATGRQWICDEVDLGRGMYVKRIGEFTANGTETWTKQQQAVYTDLHDAKRYVHDGQVHVFSERFRYADVPYHQIGYGESALYNAPQDVHPGQNWLYVCLSNEGSTGEEAKEFFTANPTKFIYELAKPIETPLSPELLTVYKALHTNYPNTNILNDEGAGTEVAYIADTKRYIDIKFDQLAKAMLGR